LVRRKKVTALNTPFEMSLEALSELADLQSDGERPAFLAEAAVAVRARFDGSPAAARALLLLAELGDDPTLSLTAGGALVVLGAATDDERVILAEERRRETERQPRARRPLADEEWTRLIEHPGARGPLAEAWSAVAESAARAGEVDPLMLGFNKTE